MAGDAGADVAWSTRYGPAVAYTVCALGVTVAILIAGELKYVWSRGVDGARALHR